MAIANYSDLKSAIGTWNLNRTNLPTADLVTLAEARLNRDLRLRVMEAESTLTGTIGSRYITLPTGFLEPLDLWLELSFGRRQMTPVSVDTMPNWPNAIQPQFWAVDGSGLAFESPCDQAYTFTLRYLQRFALSDAAPTNWLLTNWPDLYLSACNIEAALWLQDDEQAQRWQTRYGDALTSVNAKEARSRTVAPMRVDVALQPRSMRGSVFNISRGF